MPEKDPLRVLLREKIREACEEAAISNGEVSRAKLEAIEHLSRLAELECKSQPIPPPARWPVAALLASTLILVSFLLFLHVPDTEVEMELVLSEVGFELSGPQVLTGLWNLTELRASGLRQIQFPDSMLPQAVLPTPAGQNAIRVSVNAEGQQRGEVTLAPLRLPSSTEVRVFEKRSSAAGRLVLTGANVPLRATLNGPVQFAPDISKNHPVHFNIPKSLLLESDPEGTNLDVVFAGEAEFSPHVSIQKLSLSRVDQFQTLDGTIVQPISTILSGTLYLESLNGAKYQLRPREPLRFGQIRGIIRTLEFIDGHIRLNFRGTVRGMHSGWGATPMNLMPTYLEWLQARHGLSLLWGATLYLFGLLAAVARWWRLWQ